MPEKSSSVEALNLKTTPEADRDAEAISDTGNTRVKVTKNSYFLDEFCILRYA